MDKHTISVLEFTKIKEMLSKYNTTVIGKEIIDQLVPQDCVESIRFALKETTEMREILLVEGRLPLSSTEDIRDELKRSKISGTIIDASKILKILKVLRVSREIKKYFTKTKEKYPLNKKRLEKIKYFNDLEKQITQCIGDEGEILDRASPELRKIRREIIRKEQSIKNKLDNIIRSSQFYCFVGYDTSSFSSHRSSQNNVCTAKKLYILCILRFSGWLSWKPRDKGAGISYIFLIARLYVFQTFLKQGNPCHT